MTQRPRPPFRPSVHTLAMAQDLSHLRQPTRAQQAAIDLSSAMVRRVAVLERYKARVVACLDAFEKQLQALPAEHGFRIGAQRMLDTLREQEGKAEQDIAAKETSK